MEFSRYSLSTNTTLALVLILLTSSISKIITMNSEDKSLISSKNKILNSIISNMKYIEILIAIIILNFKKIGLVLSLILFTTYLIFSIFLFLKKTKLPCRCFGKLSTKPINLLSILSLSFLIMLNIISFFPHKGEPGLMTIIFYFISLILLLF